MSNEIVSVIKQEFVKTIPIMLFSVMLFGGSGYGYFSTLNVLPASAIPTTSQLETNFMHTSMQNVNHNPSHAEQCHIHDLAHDVNNCYNTKPLVGWCFYPKMPGPC